MFKAAPPMPKSTDQNPSQPSLKNKTPHLPLPQTTPNQSQTMSTRLQNLVLT